MTPVPCIKCKAHPHVVTHSKPCEGLFVRMECTCGRKGPETQPTQNPMEHMDYAEARAARLWNRDNIPGADRFAKPTESKYPEHVT